MTVSVDLAIESDLEALSVLFDQYRQFYQQPANSDATKEFIGERLRQQDSHLLLARLDNGHAAGFTQLYPVFSSVAMRPLWILNDLFVASDARRQGVAKALMQAAKVLALKHGVSGLKLATAIDNHQASRLYVQLGYQKMSDFDHYMLKLM